MDDLDLIEPATIDEARLQMVRQLHRAIYGDVWARPISPSAVWSRLLDIVRAVGKTRSPQPELGASTGEAFQPFPDSTCAEYSTRLDRVERLLIMTIGADPKALAFIMEDRSTQFGDLRSSLVEDIYERRSPEATP